MTAEDALSRFFVDQGLFPEGSTAADWIGDRWYRMGGVPVLPLVGKLKQSLILHDIHHLVTGYDTSWNGELELAGWELGSGGCHTHFFFWFDRIGAFTFGLLLAPRRVWRALVKFGAPLSQLKETDLTSPGLVFQIGVAPSRIDILTSIDGVQFTEAWKGQLELGIEGIRVHVIGRPHLIANKKAVGRPQDLADVARLEGDKP